MTTGDSTQTKTELGIYYDRLSSQVQVKGVALDAHENEVKRYAQVKSIELAALPFVDIMTGTRRDRPKLIAMMRYIKEHNIKHVLVYDVSRMSRRLIHLLQIHEAIEKSGAKIHYVKYGGILPKVFIAFLGQFAEEERERLLTRTRDGMNTRADKGLPMASSMPQYGYRYVRKEIDPASQLYKHRGYLEQVPEEVAWIKKMVRWALFGDENSELLGSLRIANKLNAMGVPPPSISNTIRRARRKSGSGIWHAGTVYRILKNPILKGDLTYNKRLQVERPRKNISGKHSGEDMVVAKEWRDRAEWIVRHDEKLRIISDKWFKALQRQFARNAELSKRNGRDSTLLSKRIECECGYAMVLSYGPRRDGGTPYVYYKCNGKAARQREKNPNHRPPNLRAGDVDTVVWAALCEGFKHPEVMVAEVKRRRQLQNDANADWIAQLENAKRDASKASDELKKLARAFVETDLPNDTLREMQREIEAHKIKADATIEELQIRLGLGITNQQIESIEDFAPRVAAGLERLTRDEIVRLFTLLRIKARVHWLVVQKPGDPIAEIEVSGLIPEIIEEKRLSVGIRPDCPASW